MQVSAREFLDHYPKHSEWLDAVISEMNQGVRLAYGVIVPRVAKGSKIVQEIAGSIIIKKGQYSKVVEMKNLYIADGYRNKGYGKKLYREVEKYCRRKGYQIIETEVPCGELKTIDVLHKWGFTVTKRLDSRFKNGDRIYLMEKRIRPSYSGDPFDFRMVCEWFIEEKWGCATIKREDGFTVFSPRSNMSSGDNLARPRFAVLTVEDNAVSKSLIDRASHEADMLIHFGKDPKRIDEHIEHVKLMDKDEVFSSMQSDLGYPRPKFDVNSIGGIIVSFNPEITARLRQRLEKDAPYYKGGPIGKYVQEGHAALLFSEGDSEIPLGGIVGYAKIKRVEVGSPNEVKSKLSSSAEQLIDDDHYTRLFHTKSTVIGLILGDLKMIKPMDKPKIEEFLGEISEIEMSEIGHRYISQQEFEEFESLSEGVSRVGRDGAIGAEVKGFD
jgi:ribosomal protein S18 acetylase RimI-like enzyme